MATQPTLRRRLSLVHITLYGLGTTIGAGIYALIGEVAGAAGMFAPISFLVAALLVVFTALSFAELSGRFPRAAGEAVYVRQGFGSNALALTIGLLVVLAAVVSSATIINGFVGYFQTLFDVPRAVAITALALALCGLAAWGIGESVTVAAVFTVMEIGGLLLIIWAGGDSLADLPARAVEFVPPGTALAWGGIMTGAFLAFYAFIGFEDMVNVAEEVKDAPKVLPFAIVITLVVTLLLYMAVAVVSVLTVPPGELAASGAPLALVFERGSGTSALPITAISVFAIVNGALIQMILASRVLYGMAGQGWIPAVLGRVHPYTRTPVIATGLVAAVILGLALWFQLGPLAKATSVVALIVFTVVNLSLWRVKRRAPAPAGLTIYPTWVPVAGAAVSAGFLLSELFRAFSA